ncbi:hypothetical protein WALSEDRAFT_60164 [Wallemia mellicola CBS 633.66]|uniref:ATP synthase F(0) complex subunit e, mitochondrial n=1 Tax=Wallemia mellicola (strain ATCC MYA-4683 / CBS 633.66) TaxID=671144 RepID=I4YDP8_WALMC|nr:hypothetical protein WALSEDRAFT_60164 [Wallemia mellicola CBS 633.66]EIM22090.1 hypothetical protein WALSEDRAFT_60164 [Wallemia mellicola CBS 633.66]|eukprot:XP_006957894.1 hypothetical protein WALSEDRAFT_60164 [Wallemia mellicola CBS 633.66]
MASVTQNVVRWSALATGVLYGAVHLRSVKNIQAKEEEHQAEKHHQELIEKARKAWDEKTASQSKSSNGLITDPENPSFDLEKFLEAKSKEN